MTREAETALDSFLYKQLIVIPQSPKAFNMASKALDIPGSSNGPARVVSHSPSISTSPTLAFRSMSPPSNFGGSHVVSVVPPDVKQLKPFDTQDIKILLLENVNVSGIELLASQGYQVEALKTSLPEAELIEKIRWGEPTPSRPGDLLTDDVLVMFMSLGLDQRQSSLKKFFAKQRI